MHHHQVGLVCLPMVWRWTSLSTAGKQRKTPVQASAGQRGWWRGTQGHRAIGPGAARGCPARGVDVTWLCILTPNFTLCHWGGQGHRLWRKAFPTAGWCRESLCLWREPGRAVPRQIQDCQCPGIEFVRVDLLICWFVVISEDQCVMLDDAWFIAIGPFLTIISR